MGSGNYIPLQLINHKPDESVCVTKPSGFITCIQKINREYVRQIGAEIDEYDIQRLLTSGGNDLPDKYREIIEKEIRAYCRQVYDHIRELGYNMDLTPIIFVGGGAGVMKQYGGLSQKNITYRFSLLNQDHVRLLEQMEQECRSGSNTLSKNKLIIRCIEEHYAMFGSRKFFHGTVAFYRRNVQMVIIFDIAVG